MNEQEKIEWMKQWCEREGLTLQLEGECGFGRECVGVFSDEVYPDYEWHDDETYERIDDNGDVWTPERAYHKHPCVAVLERDSESISQLFDWLRWFEANHFHYEKTKTDCTDPIQLMLGGAYIHRMVKQ